MQWRWRTFGQAKAQFCLLIMLALIAACNRSTPTPTSVPPTATAAAVATVADGNEAATASVIATSEPIPATATFAANQPTPDARGTFPGAASGNVTQGAIFTSPRYSYTVVLPCCWLALPTPGTAVESALAELEAESGIPVWGDLGEQMRGRNGGAVLELIALLPDEDNLALPIAQVTVSVLPTNGLTLDEYLSATEGELDRIANTSVLDAYIEPTLGVGSFPASVIEYTAVPTPANDEDAEQTMAGLQVAFFGHGGDTLIVLTFTTTIDRFESLEPQFLHIVRTVTLEEPAI